VTFQAQNPAISGDKSTHVNKDGKVVLSGWSNCTAFVAAMGAQFDSGVKLTGTQIRKESDEPVPARFSPGLNLDQVGAVLKKHGVSMGILRRVDFDDVDALRMAGHAIALQLNYSPIQHTVFSGDPKFEDGHIVLWLPNGDVFDPLDDGRRKGIAKAPVRIPAAILRSAAGLLAGNGKAFAGVFPTKHPAGPKIAPTLAFGSKAPAVDEFRVVVPIGLVRSTPSGVPGRLNVVDRKRRGTLVSVFGSTGRGQRVNGSRVWHQIDRAGRRFMHSSVIDPA
jgi:hypothetical protein